MNLKIWERIAKYAPDWPRKEEPEPEPEPDPEPEPLFHGCSFEVSDMTDALGRPMQRMEIRPMPGYRARYDRTKGVWAIEVYKLKGKRKQEGL